MNKPNNIERYQGNYSESGFRDKVKKVAKKAEGKAGAGIVVIFKS